MEALPPSSACSDAYNPTYYILYCKVTKQRSFQQKGKNQKPTKYYNIHAKEDHSEYQEICHRQHLIFISSFFFQENAKALCFDALLSRICTSPKKGTPGLQHGAPSR